jgi:ABC transporter substrate binding protein
VDKILKDAKPADLPVQQATKFEFVINLKAAKQIGLTLSPEFLSRANKVIKWWKKTKLRCRDWIEFSYDFILQDATAAAFNPI